MKLYSFDLTTFAPEILARGKDYFENGKVRIILNTQNHVHASVKGSKGEAYKVHLVFDNDSKLIDMECSCPSHQHCKHEAAVIYFLMDSVKKEEEVGEGTYQRIVSSINDAFQRKSLNGLRKAKEELITLKDKMSYEELEKATSLFVATCYKAFYYGEVDGGVHRCFLEAVDNLDKSPMDVFVAKTIESAKDLNAYSLGEVFNAFLMEDKYSLLAQKGFMDVYKGNKSLAISILNSSSVIIPNNSQSVYPPFACAIIDNIPLSSYPTFYREALKACFQNGDIDSARKIVKFLNKNHNQKYIPEETYDFLKKNGSEEETESFLLDAFYEFDSDFDSYLRLRKYVKKERFKEIAKKISPALANKSFLNAVLLRDGSLFPEHMHALSIKKLSCKEVYLCREDLDEETKDKVASLIKRKLVDPKAKTKEAVEDLFYGLLYLDYSHDFSLDTAMFEPFILKSVSSNNEYRSIWLSIASRNDMLSKAGIYPYEVKHVSH